MKKFSIKMVILFLSLFSRFAFSEEIPIARSFSLVIRGGYGIIAVGDINTTLRSLNTLYDTARAVDPDLVAGEIRRVPCLSFEGEIELQWSVGGFSLGVAVSAPVRYDRVSNLTYSIVDSAGTQIDKYTYMPEIHLSAPIKLNLYYSSSLSPGLKLLFHGGFGFYRARVAFSHQWDGLSVSGGRGVGEGIINATGNSLGYHIGIGLEYKLNHRLSFLCDGEFRLAKIKSLNGSLLTTANVYDEEGNLVSSDSMLTEGYLYHLNEEDYHTGRRSEQLHIYDEIPDYGSGFPTDIRKATLDLSGFTFRIGLKIGLF